MSGSNGKWTAPDAVRIVYVCTVDEEHTADMTVTLNPQQPILQVPTLACCRCEGFPQMRPRQPEPVERSRILQAVPKAATGGFKL